MHAREADTKWSALLMRTMLRSVLCWRSRYVLSLSYHGRWSNLRPSANVNACNDPIIVQQISGKRRIIAAGSVPWCVYDWTSVFPQLMRCVQQLQRLESASGGPLHPSLLIAVVSFTAVRACKHQISTMAKLQLLLVATLLVAVAVVAEAKTAATASPAPAPATSPHTGTKSGLLSMKLILHNVAKRSVTFKLVSPVVSNPVVALKGKWTAIEPALFSAMHTTLLVSVTVENNKHAMVNKTFTIKLLQHFKAAELTGKKFLVLTAVESWSWKSKYVLITMGEVVVFSIKL